MLAGFGVVLTSWLLACADSAASERCSSDWLACRKRLSLAIFNSTTLPARPPDFSFAGGGPQVGGSEFEMHGLRGPGNGTGVGDVSWGNNLTTFVWTIRSAFLELNATVFFSLNTSGRAASRAVYSTQRAGGLGLVAPELWKVRSRLHRSRCLQVN